MTNAKTMIDERFRRDVIFGYGTQGLKVGLGFAWMALVTSQAGIALYGMIALLGSLSAILSSALTFRTNEAVVRFYKQGEITRRPDLCFLAIVLGMVLDIFVSIVLVSIVYVSAPLIANHLLKDPLAVEAVKSYSWLAAVVFMRGAGMGLLAAQGRFRVVYSLAVAEQSLKIALFLLVLWRGSELTLGVIIWVMFAAACVVSAWVWLRTLSAVAALHRYWGSSREHFVSYVRFSLSTFVSSSLKAGTQNIDTAILGALTDPTSAGVYSIFRQFLSPLLIVVAPFHEQMYPKFVSAVGAMDYPLIRRTIRTTGTKILRWSIYLEIAVALALAVYWIGTRMEVRGDYVITFALMAATSLLLQQLWWTRGFALARKPSISIYGNSIYALMIVSLVSLLTWKLGISGAALGMLCSALVINAYWRGALRRYAPLGHDDSIGPRTKTDGSDAS